MLDNLTQDVSYAWRTLRKSPGFTGAVIFSVALGIAANTTVFSIVNAVLLGSLPVRQPDRLLNFSEGNSFAYPDYTDYRDQTKDVFEGVSANFPVVPVSLGGVAEPERIWGQLSSGNYFEVVGVPMMLGRGFAPGEDQVPGKLPVVVLSYGLWRRHFGADAAIIGKTATLNNLRYTVVGVTPAGFHGTTRAILPEFWAPLAMMGEMMPDLAKDQNQRDSSWLMLDARLKTGVSRERALAAVNVIKKRLDAAYRKDEKHPAPITLSVAGGFPGGANGFVFGVMATLMIVVGLVLLIACANVANLLLARASARQKEIGIRLAIGASRARLIRQLLSESILLSSLGAAAGFLLAVAAIRPIATFDLPLPLPIAFDFTPDARVFAFTAALSVVTGIIFGLAPALRATRPDLVATLKDQGGAIGSFCRFGMRNVLVVAQVALSLVLLVGSSLFLRSLGNASSIDLGMRTDHLLMMAFDPKLHHYTPDKTRQFLAQLRGRVEALPGVQSVSYLDNVPLSFGGHNEDVKAEGGSGATKSSNANVFSVGADFFQTIGTPLLRGRGFSSRLGAAPLAIVNETLVKRVFPGEDPIGRVLRMNDRSYEIVGVAKDSKARTIGEDPEGILYLPLEQHPEDVMSFFGISILVKTAGNPRTMTHAVRAQIAALDPNLAVFGVQTMQEHVDKSMLVPRLSAVLLGVFGAVGLVLATIGLYGVLSYSVRRRTREIGIRMALGASAKGILGLVTGQGMWLAGIGLAIGLAISFGVWRFAASLLYGISATDTVTFIGVPVLLLVVALVASVLPARRASRVDPMDALRYE